MSPSRCAHATTYACRPWPMLPAIGRHRLPDAPIPREMRTGLGWFYLPLGRGRLADARRQQRCRTADAHTPRLMDVGLSRCCLPLADARRPQPMSSRRCAYATADACRPWMMLHAFGRRHLPNAHTPRLMCPGLGRCRLSMADARKPRPVTPIQCARTTIEECRPWLMLHAVVRRRLPDSHMRCPMRAGLG